jgi:RNA polymerase sigma-70 factor (ECF subfamily)
VTDNSASEPSDGSLLRRLRKGEQDAATRLYLRYARRLHGLATAQTGQDLKSRVDPEDIVQSVFRTFFRRAQEGHYEVPDGEEIWKLFLVIGLHKIRDAAVFHRAAKRNAGRTTALIGAGESADPPAADQMAETTLRMVIDEILLNLNDSQKEIVTMRMEGAQVDEIAQATKRSHRTVERTLQKFRELLQKQIQEEPRSRSEQE